MPGNILVLRTYPAPWSPTQIQERLQDLPQEVRNEILSLRRQEDRQARLLTRMLLLDGLSMAGCAPPGGLHAFRRDPWGRPYMEGCAADISLSHCSGLAVCAISSAGRIGIDAERHQPIDPVDFASVFDDVEMNVVLRALSPARMAIQLWAIKEAVLKADGKGFLHSDPRTIPVLSSQVRCGDNIWSIRELECGHEWTCFLASANPFPIVQMETRHY